MDEEDREDGILVYDFHPKLIELLRDSELYARMQMKVIAAFSSKYALSLYEVISARIELKHKSSEEVDIDTLRIWLGVEIGKLNTWSNLRKFAIEPALREVNALSPFSVDAKPIKRGQKVAAVKLSWAKKEPFSPAEKAAVREVNRAKTGRKARIAGTVEKIMPVLTPNAIEKGYEAAAPICRIDKYRAYQDWQEEVAGYTEPPSNLTGHFIEFCKRRAREVG
jgi:plasmid replication initiation protein